MRSEQLVQAAGDVGVFVAFPILGAGSHGDALSGLVILRNALPFAVAWLVMARWFGAYHAPQIGPLGLIAVRVLRAWLVCGLVGLALRSLWFGRPWALSFAIVALLVQGLLLIAWRLGFALATRRMVREGQRRG